MMMVMMMMMMMVSFCEIGVLSIAGPAVKSPVELWRRLPACVISRILPESFFAGVGLGSQSA